MSVGPKRHTATVFWVPRINCLPACLLQTALDALTVDQALDDSRHLGAVLDDRDLCGGRGGVEEVSHLVVGC